jgi:hypothetical protein
MPCSNKVKNNITDYTNSRDASTAGTPATTRSNNNSMDVSTSKVARG